SIRDFHVTGVQTCALPISASVTPLAKIEQWIAERAFGVEEATARSTQHLAQTQVMMANSITSLRTIAQLDWKAFVEGQCAMAPQIGRASCRERGRVSASAR